jgi:hypothetical protein
VTGTVDHDEADDFVSLPQAPGDRMARTAKLIDVVAVFLVIGYQRVNLAALDRVRSDTGHHRGIERASQIAWLDP